MLPYPKFTAFVKQVFTLTLRQTRLENLLLTAFGLLQGRSCCLSRIARFLPLPTEHNDRLRRLWRFLKNPGFVPEAVYPQLLRALAPCWPAQLPLPLALDWTSAGGYELLVAALPWRGRALPLWVHACGGQWQGVLTSRNDLEDSLMRTVTTALRAVRPQLRPVWIADRGFARLSLFQFLAKLGVDFCIRVDAHTKPAGAAAGGGQHGGAHGAAGGGVGTGDLGARFAGAVWLACRIPAHGAGAGEGELVVAGLAVAGVGQAAGVDRGTATSCNLRRAVMIPKVERGQGGQL